MRYENALFLRQNYLIELQWFLEKVHCCLLDAMLLIMFFVVVVFVLFRQSCCLICLALYFSECHGVHVSNKSKSLILKKTSFSWVFYYL